MMEIANKIMRDPAVILMPYNEGLTLESIN